MPEEPHEHEQEAAKLAFDVSKQFITLALGGIAFVVGLSFSTPSAISSLLLWTTVGVFAVSTVLGLLFLMQGVSVMSVQKTYDVYATSLRIFSGFQILLVLAGAILLGPVLSHRPTTTANAPSTLPSSPSLQIQLSGQQSLSYPVEPNKNYTIEIESGKVKFSAVKQP